MSMDTSKYDDLALKELESFRQRPLGEKMRCQFCVYWALDSVFANKNRKQLALDNDTKLGVYSDVSAECRRHAPVPQDITQDIQLEFLSRVTWVVEELARIKHTDKHDDIGSTAEDHVHEWPMTNANDWCGDFVARE